jgi:hypothetical protein
LSGINCKYSLNFLLILLFLISRASFAQSPIDSGSKILQTDPIVKDTINKKYRKPLHPRRSMVESILIPGWGQVSNKQYWKVPILYAGFAVCVYSIDFANKHYQDFKKAYILRTDRDSTTIDKYDPLNGSSSVKYTESQLKSARDYYRRNLEISVIITAGVYLLNIADAYVSANLLNFDINDDLSLRINPLRIQHYKDKNYYFSGLTLNF